ncbi:MAG: hypothetical protein JNK37_19095 [Verrucomicrobiales bacterium]|nr:hypothetical protein [Verrucomicrobiales bacterium]
MTPGHPSPIGRTLVLVGTAAALLVGIWFFFPRPSANRGGSPAPSDPTLLAASHPDAPKMPKPAAPGEADGSPDEAAQSRTEKKLAGPAEPVTADPELTRALEDAFDRIARGGLSADDIREALRRMREAIHAADPAGAAAAIVAFLQSGRDAPTGLAFVVGSEGVLDEAPTWRVALLDWLAQTDPGLASDYSRGFLPGANRPDEYAIALRNLAWLNVDGTFDAEIATAFSGMLDRPEWLANPSAGFLEAFDVAVALGGADLWRQVGSVLKIEGPGGAVPEHPVNRAAFVALDRLMQREPETLIGILQETPDWLQWAPRHLTSLLTRLDVRSDAQRDFLRDYLLSGQAPAGELEYFATVFPNLNAFVGNRLVSEWEGLRQAPGLDRATLETVSAWMQDPAFAAVAPHLRVIQGRLSGPDGQ